MRAARAETAPAELDSAPRRRAVCPIATALIIGNSDGIGLALTEQLLAEGWRVVGVSRSPGPRAASGQTQHVIDVCAPEYAARLAQVVAQSGTPDVCVYCVGIGERLDLATLDIDRLVFETNLMGAVVTAQVILPAMVRATRGHFIGLSSQADRFNDPNAPSYSASKAGLSAYLEGLAPACRARGVYITNVRFGFVNTKMAKSRIRPFMISPAEAARRVRHCIARRPVRETYPKRMAVLLTLLQFARGLRRRLIGA
jgi:NAD(P)-dependent dehydrogenase (short-subunit alcohol dehydrogenase family)